MISRTKRYVVLLLLVFLFAGIAAAQNGSAVLSFPADGGINVPIFQQFTWDAVPGTDVYYLTVGSAPGLRDVYDSFEIPATVTSVKVWGLQPLNSYYARLYTEQSGVWTSHDSSFQTAPPDPLSGTAADLYSSVANLVATVRGMTVGRTNVPAPNTLLANEVQQRGLSNTADCVDYANVLLDLAYDSHILARRRNVSLTGNTFEGHTTVEYYDPFLQKWSVADATFGLMYFDDTAGVGQGVEEISALVTAQQFASVKPKYVTASGDYWMQNYYMDPLTLYLNPWVLGSSVPSS
ncbi:MAG: hypothetical protein JWN45_3159, partial [Acidobacteriaceae bacterium]|nr:hypothetical protein [Acidobacteriaceae bacterium]